MSEWRPVETAPKDGTPILGWDGEHMAVVQWWWPSNGNAADGFWDLVCSGRYSEDSEWPPTHWMPLPASPQDQEKEA